MSSETAPVLYPSASPSMSLAMPPSSTAPPQSDITSSAVQKENNITDYVAHLQVDDTFLIPTDTAASAAQDHEKLSDLTRIRNISATPPSSFLSAKDMAEMRSFISLIPLIRGKSWSEALSFLSNVEDHLKEVVGDLLQYRKELAEEDVKKIGGVEIGILRLEGAMAIMEVMRMADEDELKNRKRRMEAVKVTKGLAAEEVMDTMAMLQREDEGMDDLDISFQRQQFNGEDATNVLRINEQAMKEALIDALVDIQHEEERAESAEAELERPIRSQNSRDVVARSGSKERELREEIKTTEETVAPKKDVENLKGIERSEQRKLLRKEEPPAAIASNNDINANRVRRSLNPMDNEKPTEFIRRMKKEKGGEDKANIKAQIKDEANAAQAAKVGEGPAQKLQEKKRTRSTEDIRFGVKVKKQKV